MFIITLCFANVKWKLLFSSRQFQARKRLCNPAQLRRASPTPIRWSAQSFLALRCTVIEIGGAMMYLLFWCLMYLYPRFICCRRCLCDNRCICTALIFIVADAFFETDVSATYFSLNLQMLFSLPVMQNCICILPFLGFKDTPFANFASTPHVFDNLRMFLIEIMHLQLALSITCGYTSSKFCIFNSPKSIISDIPPYPLRSIYFMD